jgi:hypothetical protein
MLKFNFQLTALAFLTLIAASSTVPAVATQDQSPAEQLCRLRPGIQPVQGVTIASKDWQSLLFIHWSPQKIAAY